MQYFQSAHNQVRHARLRLDLRQLSPFVQKKTHKSRQLPTAYAKGVMHHKELDEHLSES